ncbi:LPXTG cell wall anchor domain-containing protein [Bacillus sp. HMF5848]|uniref:alpha-amylase family glycosyl hydrolase n=1 Tax=Bacillus sp. HMF5848 TaxID=2495421 RepID=UPI000F79913C|nr:alpha-amylase family glycosyl hydrolase [Bacillus sp. HMF5848]RSK26399.1 LPXTG cell wall anchor domain-containing protein [Bacillus sp. HMF5848]
MGKRVIGLFLIPFLLFYSVASVQAVEKEERAWQDEIIYFMMVDRFNNGDTTNDYQVFEHNLKAYNGGDFQGITEKLDYLKDMGFTALWLTPVNKNEPGGYHGYWYEDFYDTEEHFGSLDEFKKIVDEAHKRDMKVILDIVVNHTGYQHPWIQEKPDWFHEKKDIFNWANQDEVENGWLFGLPDLNTENPETRQYLLDMAKWWITETDIDGYRLDTVKHVPVDFWEEFEKEVKSVKEDFFLLGEVWHDDPRYIANYQGALDGFVDYPLFNEMTKVFAEPNHKLGGLANIWKRNNAYYEDPFLMGNFIDNHDNVRFTRLALQKGQDPVTRWKLALTYMYGAPGVPIIYYGTEAAMDGANDPDNRRMMDFTQVNEELQTHISKLAKARSEHDVLRRGELDVIYEEGGYSIFKRTLDNEVALVVINNSDEAHEALLTAEDIGEDKQLISLLNEVTVNANNDGYSISMEQETSNIFLVKDAPASNIIPILLGAVAVLMFAIGLLLARKRKNN